MKIQKKSQKRVHIIKISNKRKMKIVKVVVQKVNDSENDIFLFKILKFYFASLLIVNGSK